MNCICGNRILFENFCFNLKLLKYRFPELSEILNFKENKAQSILENIPEGYELVLCNSAERKNGSSAEKDLPVFTLKVKNKFIHSKYNPLREAEKTFAALNAENETCLKNKTPFCFYGLGLGYLQELFIKSNPHIQTVLIEPDIFLFILFLASRRLNVFFEHENLVIIPGTPPAETLAVIENIGIKNQEFKFKPSLEVSSAWFSEFQILEKRKKEKDKLNFNTLKKFGNLWLRNFMKNLEYMQSFKLKSIAEFKNAFSGFPALVIAAGPGLDKQLNAVKEYQERFVIIAVDTALRICLKNGIVPDFAVLMDAQYWNYLHVAGIEAPDTVLITEASVYPGVFRLNFKDKFLCSSFFPFGQYIENAVEKKDKLSAGGSVATTAWDFAAYTGAETVVTAGLDLAFTGKKTHFSGCLFEKEISVNACRFAPAETALHKAMFSALPETAKGYAGEVITDARLKMYAWWFESKLAETGKPAAFNLMSEGLEIPNMPNLDYFSFAEIARRSNCRSNLKKERIEKAVRKKKKLNCTVTEKRISEALYGIREELKTVSILAEEAETLCKNFNCNIPDKLLLDSLALIDKKIASSSINSVISFEFFLNGKQENSKETPLETSLEIYRRIGAVCKKYLSMTESRFTVPPACEN